MGKTIGVLSCSGDIADQLPELCSQIVKPTGAKIIFDPSPKALLQKVLGYFPFVDLKR